VVGGLAVALLKGMNSTDRAKTMREEAILVARFLRLTRPIIDEQIKQLHVLAKEHCSSVAGGASVPSPMMPAHAPANPVASGISVSAALAPAEAMDEDYDEEEALQRALALSMSCTSAPSAPVTTDSPPQPVCFVWNNETE